jgi:hypothetical protein
MYTEWRTLMYSGHNLLLYWRIEEKVLNSSAIPAYLGLVFEIHVFVGIFQFDSNVPFYGNMC